MQPPGNRAFAAKTRVVLVDDHPLFRVGLATIIAREPDLDVVGHAGNASEILALAREIEIDVAIVDILMPAMSGITLTSELLEIQPAIRVLALSMIEEPCLIADMLRARACGFALKTQSTAEIVDAIRKVRGGLRYLPPSVPADLVNAELARTAAQPHEPMTRRERQVFELIIRGHSNDEIARAFSISRRTVETHRQRVMNKLSAHSVAELQRVAALHGARSTAG